MAPLGIIRAGSVRLRDARPRCGRYTTNATGVFSPPVVENVRAVTFRRGELRGRKQTFRLLFRQTGPGIPSHNAVKTTDFERSLPFSVGASINHRFIEDAQLATQRPTLGRLLSAKLQTAPIRVCDSAVYRRARVLNSH